MPSAKPVIAAAGSAQFGEDVVEVKRVRSSTAGGMRGEQLLPADIGRQMFSLDLSGDIFPMLENLFGIPPARWISAWTSVPPG